MTYQVEFRAYSPVSAFGPATSALSSEQAPSVAGPLTSRQARLKRAADLLLATLALLVAVPLCCLAAIAIRLDTRGPVLFIQMRRGLDGRPFRIWKLRTMLGSDESRDAGAALPDAHRITRVGRWLRSLSLDELPQLWNVLRGEMSLVGPRPHALHHDASYDRLVADYSSRRCVLPGLTGWAQVNGLCGPAPHLPAMIARVEHDLWYARNWSLRLDLVILARTLPCLFRPRAC